MAEFQTDIVIVGAGPVGLFAIFEAGMLKMRAHVVDTLEAITGGQCSGAATPKSTDLRHSRATPASMAADLVEKLRSPGRAFQSPTYHLGQRVDDFKGSEEMPNTEFPNPQLPNYGDHLRGQRVIACKAIIIAAGCGAFGPNRPPMEGLEAYEGKSVFYLVSKREDFRGKKVVIAGGGDSAVDWAISLSELAEKLYVVHRRPKFRCAPESAGTA